MIKKWVVTTQYLENYNIDEPKEGYWKFKGGCDYLIECERDQDAVAYIYDTECTSNEVVKEFPIDWKSYDEWYSNLPTDEEYKQFLLNKLREVNYEL